MDKPKNEWVLIVHGRAKTILQGKESANRKGCLTAVQAGAEAGAIVLDATGGPGVAHNSDHLAIGIAATNIEPVSGLHRDELGELLYV